MPAAPQTCTLAPGLSHAIATRHAQPHSTPTPPPPLVPPLQALHLGLIKVVTNLPNDSRYLQRLKEALPQLEAQLAQ
jgi:hypothetical protein